MHQFVSAGVAVQNPDDPDRAPNSPKWCYQISPAAKSLLATYGTKDWEHALKQWHAGVKTLEERYEAAGDGDAAAVGKLPAKVPG